MRRSQRAVCRSAVTSQLQMDRGALEGFRREMTVKWFFSLWDCAISTASVVFQPFGVSEHYYWTTNAVRYEKKKRF